MIVTILGSSSTFNGVDYNERKSVNGRGELLVAKNFSALELKGGNVSKQDYIDYFKDYSSSNARIVDSQFHAVLSCKEKENTFEELVDMGEKYLEFMGYADNPYLIYAHTDTKNNHIHIVSSRVGQDGKKINDSYEYVRSQNFLNKALNIDSKLNFENSIEHAKSYKFSTVGQFRMLMENKGFVVVEKDGALSFIRGGVQQGSMPIEDVKDLFTELKDYDRKRIAQVKQLFEKYKDGYNTALKWQGEKRPGQNDSSVRGKYVSDFSEQMRVKFGLELIYHVAKDKNVYSYSIVDHTKNQVYKGSDILGLKVLLGSSRGEQSRDTLMEQVNTAVVSKIGFSQLQSNLKVHGFILSSNGAIRIKGGKDIIISLDNETLKSLKYQSRLNNSNLYVIPGGEEAKVLARLSHVDYRDLVISETYDTKHLREKLNSVFFNQADLKAGLSGVGIEVVKYNSDFFLLDKNDKVIINASSVLSVEQLQELKNTDGISFKNIGNEYSSSEASIDYQKSSGRYDYYNGPESDLVSLDEISNLIGGIHDESDPAESEAKRRKRSR